MAPCEERCTTPVLWSCDEQRSALMVQDQNTRGEGGRKENAAEGTGEDRRETTRSVRLCTIALSRIALFSLCTLRVAHRRTCKHVCRTRCAAFEVESGSVTSPLCPGPSLTLALFSVLPRLYQVLYSLPAKAAEIWFTYVIRVAVHAFPTPTLFHRGPSETGPSISCLLFAFFI